MLLVAVLTAGCPPGSAGRFVPVGGQRGDEAGSAVVRDGAVSATMTARWASEASQSADIVYRNDGATPVSVILSRLSLKHKRLGEAPLWSAVDMTDVDRDDARTDNDDPPIVYDLDTSPATTSLLLKPGETRRLLLGFTNFPGIDRITEGDHVTATVPLAARSRMIEMVAE